MVDDISCLLKVPRRALHVVGARLRFLIRPIRSDLISERNAGSNCFFHQFATSKGFISGDLCYMENDGTRISCSSSQAVAVSSNISGITSILSSVFTRAGRTCARFPRLVSRYRLICEVRPHRGEGCNFSEAPG